MHTGRDVQNQLVKPQLTVYDRLANMFANGNSSDSGVEAVGKAFDLYRSCMDAAAIESLGATPLLNLIRDSLGTTHAYMHECNLN
jgi:predicted metalloendopeptidase